LGTPVVPFCGGLAPPPGTPDNTNYYACYTNPCSALENAKLEAGVTAVINSLHIMKGGKSVFGYKQHTMVDDNGLVMAITTSTVNCHDSKPLLSLLERANIRPGTRIHADKAYSSQKHRDALKSCGIKNAFRIRL
jgi:IS5 family transposase